MQHSVPARRRAILVALAIVTLAPAARAQSVAFQASTTAPQLNAGAMAATTDFVLDVTGIRSWGLFSDPLNTRRTLNIGANARVVGLGWSFTQTATRPSFLSQMVVLMGSSTQSYLGLVGDETDNFSGTRSYTSGGVLDLLIDGADFSVLADGLLQFEFFETVDDFADAADGTWDSGTLTIRVESASVVPEPATVALTATGLLLLGAVQRRRRRRRV
jgi:hypothetical protein